MFRSIRNAFIAGLFVILPLGVTIIVINFLLDKLGTPSSKFFFYYLDADWRDQPVFQFGLEVLSIFFVLFLITLLGYGSKFFVGRWVLSNFEQLLGRVPFINSVYRTVKQIVDTFSREQRAIFQKVVLVEYPRKHSYVIGFLTSEAKGETQAATGEKTVNVFVPTTPNPTSGFLLLLPEKDVTHLEMSVADGMKLIISGGAVVPDPEKGESIQPENPKAMEGETLQ